MMRGEWYRVWCSIAVFTKSNSKTRVTALVFFFFFKIYFSCGGSLLLCTGFLWLLRVGSILCCGVWASNWCGFSCCSLPCCSNGKESACNVGDLGLIPGLGRFSGEGNGNPLQYSYLENPMDRGAWQATVRTVTKSQTQLSYYHYYCS